MLVMAMVVAGVVAFPSLGIDRYPKTDLPTVFIRTGYPGAASQEVESEIAQVIEDAVSTVAGRRSDPSRMGIRRHDWHAHRAQDSWLHRCDYA